MPENTKETSDIPRKCQNTPENGMECLENSKNQSGNGRKWFGHQEMTRNDWEMLGNEENSWEILRKRCKMLRDGHKTLQQLKDTKR